MPAILGTRPFLTSFSIGLIPYADIAWGLYSGNFSLLDGGLTNDGLWKRPVWPWKEPDLSECPLLLFPGVATMQLWHVFPVGFLSSSGSPQRLQGCCDVTVPSSSCVLMWVLRLQAKPNFLPQWGHSWGLSPIIKDKKQYIVYTAVYIFFTSLHKS
jgi:hypothetical protein